MQKSPISRYTRTLTGGPWKTPNKLLPKNPLEVCLHSLHQLRIQNVSEKTSLKTNIIEKHKRYKTCDKESLLNELVITNDTCTKLTVLNV